jgi:formylglycine-generating enzyme required for sulfatase activity
MFSEWLNLTYRYWGDNMLVVTGIALILLAASATEDEKYTNSIGMRMIRIKPGTFLMGSLNPTPPEKLQGPKHLSNGDWDEKPVHNVTISKPFYISETEITIEQFQKFRPDYEDHGQFTPFASTLSWHDATAFCEWLSKKEGKTYRLPTEAEWEYACRAATRTLFSSGDNPPKHGERNTWGLVNMHTGAPEWCLDWHGMYTDDDQVDPVGPERGIARVVRG